MKLSRNQKAVIALIIANTIWGAASPIFKWSLENVGTYTLAFLRFFLATYILLPFTYKNLHIKRQHISTLILASITGITFNIAFYFLALHYTASINVPIIGSSGPIILLIFSAIFLKEKPKTKVINGMLISFIGIILVIIGPTAHNDVNSSIFGNILIIISTVASVTQTIIAKKLAKFYDFKAIVFWESLIGSITFLPFMLNEVRLVGLLPHLDIAGIIGILFGAIFSSAIGYTCYQYALQNMNASETGVFTYLDPIAAIVIAVPLLHEVITFNYALGSLLVFLGIYISEGRLHYHPLHKLSEGLKSII